MAANFSTRHDQAPLINPGLQGLCEKPSAPARPRRRSRPRPRFYAGFRGGGRGRERGGWLGVNERVLHATKRLLLAVAFGIFSLAPVLAQSATRIEKLLVPVTNPPPVQ